MVEVEISSRSAHNYQLHHHHYNNNNQPNNWMNLMEPICAHFISSLHLYILSRSDSPSQSPSVCMNERTNEQLLRMLNSPVI